MLDGGMKIGAVVRIGPDDTGKTPRRYAEIREMARRVEAAGLDSLWVHDHLLYRWPGRPTDGIWECWTVLSGLAEATERVELGTLVLCSPFRNPALVAKMACTLDEVSGGRFTLGLGAGWHRPEFDAFGVPFDHRASRFEEALQIVAPLLRSGQVNFQGRYYAARDCEILPGGPRPGGPPLLLAGAGPRLLHLGAKYADAWNCAWYTTADSARGEVERVRSAGARRLAVTVSVSVSYPNLGPRTGPGGSSLTGSPEAIGTALADYANLGVSHLMVDFSPHTAAALEPLAAAVQYARARLDG
jgi:alkanesulfonate monooxygenase SsuD/methylene tetrahydromethanopterin reductase-like flavin-dependent oxidoreductase (luciferase family)